MTGLLKSQHNTQLNSPANVAGFNFVSQDVDDTDQVLSLTRNPVKIFYGWWIVAASVVTALYAGGVVFYGFTAIFEPISKELGWSYTQISTAASLRGLEMSILAPLAGIAIDRWGPKRIVFGGVVSTIMGLLLLSQVHSIAIFYAAFIFLAIGMSGTSMNVLMAATAYWFRKRVGIASGIALCGYGFSGLLVMVMVKLIDAYGWRQALVILAIGMLVLVLPLSFVFRHKPEQYGYLPDGETAKPTTSGNEHELPSSAEIEVKVGQALRSKAFWFISVAYISHALLVNAVITHVMPYLSSVSVSRETAALVATGIPLLSVIGRLGFGWLGDKWNRKSVTAVGFVMLSLGMISFAFTSSSNGWPLAIFLALFGVGFGGLNTVRPILVREYFGRAYFGTIFGLVVGVNFIGNVVGPVLGGWAYDRWGTYQGIWLIMAVLPLLALALILTISPVNATRSANKS
ncbi:MAG: MFS transporter [Chloroflexi bacterium]|nr:MFS transporter [Chloroflexota bacterium]